jgi:hypothetical protein
LLSKAGHHRDREGESLLFLNPTLKAGLVTFSDARRTDNVNHALGILMSALGNRALSDYAFMQTSSIFAGILPTTWDELQQQSWIRTTDSLFFFLTGSGWKAGLKLTGQLDDDFRNMAFKLVGALKEKVAERLEDACVCVHDFETDGITAGWVFNVVESRVLEDIDPPRSYDLRWSAGDPWNSDAPFFKIPRTLGQTADV